MLHYSIFDQSKHGIAQKPFPTCGERGLGFGHEDARGRACRRIESKSAWGSISSLRVTFDEGTSVDGKRISDFSFPDGKQRNLVDGLELARLGELDYTALS